MQSPPKSPTAASSHAVHLSQAGRRGPILAFALHGQAVPGSFLCRSLLFTGLQMHGEAEHCLLPLHSSHNQEPSAACLSPTGTAALQPLQPLDMVA